MSNYRFFPFLLQAYKYSPVSAMDSASIDNNVIVLCNSVSLMNKKIVLCWKIWLNKQDWIQQYKP